MSFETACKSVDLLINSVIEHDGDTATVVFFGGEPLLEFNLIEKIVEYTNSRIPSGLTIHYLITTNGTLLEQKHIALMRQNNFRVMLSIDGDESSHNAYRTYPNGNGSYVDVVKAAKMLLNNVPVEARITVTDKNTDIDKSIAHLLSLGIRRTTYALNYQMSSEGFSRFMVALERLFTDYRSAIVRGEYFDCSNITAPIAAIVLKKKRRSRCSAGISYLSVSAEGTIYRCHRFTGNEKFALGDVQQAESKEVTAAVGMFNQALKRDAKDRNQDCSNCVFAYLCGGICYHHAATVMDDEFSSIPRECVYQKRLYELMLELLCSLTTSERRGFLLYLNQFWQRERG